MCVRCAAEWSGIHLIKYTFQSGASANAVDRFGKHARTISKLHCDGRMRLAFEWTLLPIYPSVRRILGQELPIDTEIVFHCLEEIRFSSCYLKNTKTLQQKK